MKRWFGLRANGLALIVAAAAVATVALAFAIATVPGRTETFVRWHLFVIGVLAVFGVVRAVVARYPVDWRPPAAFAALPATPPPEQPKRLREIERLVAYAQWDAADFHARLRPVLRAIAAQRLDVYRTIDINDDRAARTALGDPVWELLRAKDPATIRRDVGIDLSDLRATVDMLEALDDQPDD